MKNFVIAIDGPAGSGKSTTARLVADQLGFLYVDTGAMYRAASLAVLRSGVAIGNEHAVGAVVAPCSIVFTNNDGMRRIILNGEDVTKRIRDSDVTDIVSTVSSYQAVREKMVALQRGYASEGAIVMDGRDIGTVVFPDADVKIFLFANLHARAKRRQRELPSESLSLRDIELQLSARDTIDSSRALSPLRKAGDAIEIDTTGLTIEEQVFIVVNEARNKLNKEQT